VVTVILVSRDVICSKTQDHLSNVCVRCFDFRSGQAYTLFDIVQYSTGPEILEGQQTTQEDAQIHLNETFHVDRNNLNNNETVQKISVITKSSGNNVNIILRHNSHNRVVPFQ
jgi:hypothetical protein